MCALWSPAGGLAFLYCVCCVFVCVCLCVICGRLLGGGGAGLLALVCGVYCGFVAFHWYPGSGVVLDCVDS